MYFFFRFQRLLLLDIEWWVYTFHFGTLSIFDYFRAFIISDDNSADVHTIVPLHTICLFFFLATLKTSLFIIHVMKFNNDVPKCSFLCIYPACVH